MNHLSVADMACAKQWKDGMEKLLDDDRQTIHFSNFYSMPEIVLDGCHAIGSNRNMDEEQFGEPKAVHYVS